MIVYYWGVRISVPTPIYKIIGHSYSPSSNLNDFKISIVKFLK